MAGIADNVGATPQAWNGGVFGMIRNLSDNVILPIAGVILALVATLELIQMIVDRNNMHDMDTFMLAKWVFKTACAVVIVTNTWNIVMAVFDVAQSVVSSLIVSMHIRAIDQAEAVKMVKRKITELDRTKIEEQKRAVRSGYDMDILPSDLTTLDVGAKDMLKSLQNHNERMLMLTFILVNAADTKRKLKADVQQCRSIAQTMNCSLVTLDFQQERAMQAALPLGVNPIRIERGLTTSALGIFIPFTTQELFQKSEGALYYGVNSLSHNMILVDRKLLSNPNGLILGTPGSGKSFAAKREMVNVFLVTDDDIIICDPEAEYAPLVRRLHGQIIRISPVGSDYINPLDINMNYADEEDPVTLKSDFVLSMCELIVGGKEGLQPIEKTVIDRCVRSVYQAYFADPKPETMPILEDLYVELKIQPEPEAQRIATALEIYVHGSLNLFNHRTNVNLKNRLVCYDIKGLGKQLKKLGMLIVQDQVWNRVTVNRAQKKSTRYYMDEFHLLLKEPQTAAYSVEIWKRFRKWGGIPTAITQNLKDLLASAEIENIFENSDFILMLNQAPGDREILAKKLGISARQLSSTAMMVLVLLVVLIAGGAAAFVVLGKKRDAQPRYNTELDDDDDEEEIGEENEEK